MFRACRRKAAVILPDDIAVAVQQYNRGLRLLVEGKPCLLYTSKFLLKISQNMRYRFFRRAGVNNAEVQFHNFIIQ